MEICILILICIICDICAVNSPQNHPLGHGLELGYHRPSDGHIEVLTEPPNPTIFWEKYVSKRTPVLFRAAAKHFPSFSLWTDDYLKTNFGDLEVKLEAKYEKGVTPVGEKGLGRDTISNFLKSYKNKDIYIVSQLPDPMAKDVQVLSCLSCGTFSKRILEANLWLSNGGTSSLLHRDADNAINCLLNGTKNWILINPEHEKNIPIAKGDLGYGGFAVLDVDNVNILKYNDFQHVSWHYANMTQGDCLYLPYGYWHQVRSYGSKNMAVSVLFSRLNKFDPSGCDKDKYESHPLSTVNMVWTYPGYGPQTLGNSDPFEIRDVLMEVVKESRENSNVLNTLIFYQETMKMLNEDTANETVENMYKYLFNVTNGDINEKAINNLTTEQLKILASYIDEDQANTIDYEYAAFHPDKISKIIEKSMSSDDGKLSKETLIKQNMIAGGSEKVAQEMFSQMDLNKDGVVDKDEMAETIDEVLQLFKKKTMVHDKSYDYYIQELSKDKTMMKNENKNHEEL